MKTKTRRKTFLSFLFAALFAGFAAQGASAQKIKETEYASQADVKVYVCEYESQADLKVYVAEYQSEAKASENKGIWYFVEYPSQADKKIFFVDYPSQADLKIYFCKYRSQAGWRNTGKRHLLF